MQGGWCLRSSMAMLTHASRVMESWFWFGLEGTKNPNPTSFRSEIMSLESKGTPSSMPPPQEIRPYKGIMIFNHQCPLMGPGRVPLDLHENLQG